MTMETLKIYIFKSKSYSVNMSFMCSRLKPYVVISKPSLRREPFSLDMFSR